MKNNELKLYEFDKDCEEFVENTVSVIIGYWED